MVYVDIQAHNFSLRKAIYAYGKNTVQIIKNIEKEKVKSPVSPDYSFVT